MSICPVLQDSGYCNEQDAFRYLFKSNDCSDLGLLESVNLDFRQPLYFNICFPQLRNQFLGNIG